MTRPDQARGFAVTAYGLRPMTATRRGVRFCVRAVIPPVAVAALVGAAGCGSGEDGGDRQAPAEAAPLPEGYLQEVIPGWVCAEASCETEAADYYVAPDGDDTNPGSEDSPFATVQAAHDAAQPGDLIYLRGGTYHPTEQTRFRTQASTDAFITMKSYPGEVVIIDGSNRTTFATRMRSTMRGRPRCPRPAPAATTPGMRTSVSRCQPRTS